MSKPCRVKKRLLGSKEKTFLASFRCLMGIQRAYPFHLMPALLVIKQSWNEEMSAPTGNLGLDACDVGLRYDCTTAFLVMKEFNNSSKCSFRFNLILAHCIQTWNYST